MVIPITSPLRATERPSGASRIDDCVGLQVLRLMFGAERAVLGADDARAHRLVQFERAAYGQHPVADLGRLGIAQANERKRGLRVDLQHRCIVFAIRAHLFHGELLAVGRLYQ